MIILVYGKGGEFMPAHVERLAGQVRRHAPAGTEIMCITDDWAAIWGLVDQVAVLQPHELAWGWKGCWPKLAMFRWPGPRLYLDLDVNIVGDLSPLFEAAAAYEFLICRDFWACHPPQVNASVVGWSGDASYLYRKFETEPVTEARPGTAWNDQEHMRFRARGLRVWQDVLPGMVTSYKRGALLGADLSDVRVVVSHGKPRPWAPDGADAFLPARGKILTCRW